MLKLHLDFADMPSPEVGWGNRIPGGIPLCIPPGFDDTLATAAAELSRTLSPSLEEIWMFRYDYDPLWVAFDITRSVVDGKLRIGVVRKEYVRY